MLPVRQGCLWFNSHKKGGGHLERIGTSHLIFMPLQPDVDEL